MNQNFKILKFGGSSIQNAESIKNVAKIISQLQLDCEQITIIVSAFGGVTDKLINLAASIGTKDTFILLATEIKTHHVNICEDLGLEINSRIENLFSKLISEKQLKSTIPENQFKDQIISYGERISSHIISDYLNKINLNSEPLDARKVIITDDHFIVPKGFL